MSKKKILNKKHLSQKLWNRRICTFWDICQFFLKPMALRYMEKLTFVWKCTYSVIPKFLWQISSCKIGVQNDPPNPQKYFKNQFYHLWDLIETLGFHKDLKPICSSHYEYSPHLWPPKNPPKPPQKPPKPPKSQKIKFFSVGTR